MQNNVRYLVIFTFLLAGIGVLVLAALDSNWIKTMSVDEYVRRSANLRSTQVQIYGKVSGIEPAGELVTGSTTFQVAGAEGGVMKFKFDHTLPPNFRPGADVLVICTADRQGVLSVNNILTKCPSKYTSGKNK